MLIDFQPVPEFIEGQPIAAEDLNTFNLNNSYIYKMLAAPQPLFMDAHAYAPKALPLSWYSPDFTIWKGAILYRTGMNYADIGVHIKMDGMLTDIGNSEISEYSIGDLGTTGVAGAYADGVALGIIVKYTEFSYLNIYKTAADSIYYKYYSAAPLNIAGTNVSPTATKGGTYTFTVKDGSGRNQAKTGDYLTANARITNVRVDLTNLDLKDGEIVPISLILLVNINPRKSDPTDTANYQSKYANFSNYFLGRSTNKLTKSEVILNHIFYSTLYAKTDGDLSYTDNWPAVSGVVVSGTSVLSTANMNKLTGKQRYIVDRLKNKPMPLTGSLFYLTSWGGTASVKYPQYDVYPGDWSYTKENYAVPISKDNDYYPDGVGKFAGQVDVAAQYNPQSSLATFAWNPYFDVYNELLVSLKYFGNTQARQVLIVDMPEAPVSLTSVRNNIITLTRGTEVLYERSGHIYGYSNGGKGTGLNARFYGFYGSVYSAHNTNQYVNNPNAIKTYLNHMYQVRVPSTNTKVYSPEFGSYNPGNEFYFGRGMYQDDVSILFDEKSEDLWGLIRAADPDEPAVPKTLQYGFFGNYTATELSPYYTQKTGETEFQDKQYTRSTTYNNSDWNWKITDNRTKGYSQVYLNLYDHQKRSLAEKASYIGYFNIIGLSDFNAAGKSYTVPTQYTMLQELTYSGLVTGISEINTRLDDHYDALFVSNPHFKDYNMFWESPKSPLILRNIYKDYTDKFFYFTKQRVGNVLIVRGKNVSMYYGEIKKLERKTDPYGSFHKIDDVDVEFEYSESIISGDDEQTAIFHFTRVPRLGYNERYYIKGDEVVYAAELFEEPS
jgi:hypothetical protein